MSQTNTPTKSNNAFVRVQSASSFGSTSQDHAHTDDDTSSSDAVVRTQDACTIGSLIREHAPVQRPIYHPIRNDAFRNLVSLLGQQTIADPIVDSDQEDYDGDESGSEDDDHTSKVVDIYSVTDESADEDDSSSIVEYASSEVEDASSEVEDASSEAEDASSEVEIFNNTTEAFPSRYPPQTSHIPVTSLRSPNGVVLTEAITLNILNILKADRQNKTLTNFQRASQYCYSLAQPIIWTEFVIQPKEYRKLSLIDYKVRQKMRAIWVEEGWPGPHVPNESERRIWNNYNTRQKVVMITTEASEQEPQRAAVQWYNRGTWAAL